MTAHADELLGIARAIGATGRGVFEAVFEDPDVAGHFGLLRRMCEVSGRPLSVTTLQRPGQPRMGYRELLTYLEQAAVDGLTMRGQVAARPVGLLMSLRGRVHPLLASPTYQALASQGVDHAETALRRSEVKARVIEELLALGDPMARYPQAQRLGDPPSWAPDPARSIAKLAEAARITPLEVAYDIVVGGDMVYVPVANFVDGDFSALREMLVHELTVPGLGDGEAHCTMIADFDFPTFLLSYWARDVEPEQRLPIEWVVKRQCADTARLVGLTDRGVITSGMKADLNLIDLENLAITAPHIVNDLPGGGSRLVNRAHGYVATVVAGEPTFENGSHSGAFAGALVRGGRSPKGASK